MLTFGGGGRRGTSERFWWEGSSGGDSSVNLGFGWYFIQITVFFVTFLPCCKGKPLVSWCLKHLLLPHVDQVFHQQNVFIQEKERVATQGMHSSQAICTLWPACQDGGVFTEGRRKLMGGDVRTTELYYKLRILPVEFSSAGFSWLHRVRELL